MTNRSNHSESQLPEPYPTNGALRGVLVETEALSQRIIVDIVRSRLDELIPEPLENVHERETEQRQEIKQ